MSSELPGMEPIVKSAQIDGPYRYELTRHWGNGGTMAFVMLNPSTADADLDDPTIRRCMGFARREGMGGISVVNLFAWRETDPRYLPPVDDEAIGPLNDRKTTLVMQAADVVVAAWGAHPRATERAKFVLSVPLRTPLVCLGTTKAGAPRHPLYVRGDQPLVPVGEGEQR